MNGQPQSQPPYSAQGTQPGKSKVLAGVLGILLGSLGIHNFYLGHTKRGLIQLLVSVLSAGTLSIFMWIWALIESINILTGKVTTDARGVPLQ